MAILFLRRRRRRLRSHRIPFQSQIQGVLRGLQEFPRLLQRESVDRRAVDLVDVIPLLNCALFVRDSPVHDLLDVDLAAQDDSEVLLLLVPRQTNPETLLLELGLCWGGRGENDAALHDEVDRLAGVTEHLDGDGVVHVLQRDVVGRNDPVVDSEKQSTKLIITSFRRVIGKMNYIQNINLEMKKKCMNI